MIRKPSPATLEELAEIHALRNQADATGEEIAGTVAALAGKLAETSPQALARKKAAQARVRTWQAARRAVSRAARPFGTGRTGLAAAGLTSGILVAVAIAVAWQHRRRA